MVLQDIFDAMSFGEFSQISLGGQDSGVINEHNWNILIPHINLGLTDLHKRFYIREGRVKLNLLPQKTMYRLHSNHALTNRNNRYEKYILDSKEAPYQDDLLKIEKVLAKGTELHLNDLGDKWSVITLGVDLLKLPDELITEKQHPDYWNTKELEIIYRANHPKISIPLGFFNPSREEVQLPEAFLNALVLFVASRVFFPIGLQNEQRISTNYAAKYEAECLSLIHQGVDLNRMETHYKFSDNGWI